MAKHPAYGGDFAWADVPYQLHVEYGVSPMQWMQGAVKMLLDLDDIMFSADGTFSSPTGGGTLFPVSGIDLKWRYDKLRRVIVIDFFFEGELMTWRWDELMPRGLPATAGGAGAAPDLEGVGFVWPFSFQYTFVRKAASAEPTTSLEKGVLPDNSFKRQSTPAIGVEPAALGAGSGYLGHLTAAQSLRLSELELRLKAEPAPWIEAHAREGQKRRLLRFLRVDKFDVEKAFVRVHENARWWSDYGMGNFAPEDEFDERGPCFVCGQDRWGRPTLICRPCAHVSRSYEDSVRAVRRAVFTVQRCVERLPPGLEKFCLIYDLEGVSMANMDYTFAQELVRTMERHFPERLDQVIIINSSWFVSTTLGAMISPLLDPATRQHLSFATSDFDAALLALVEEDHPYMRYAVKVRQSGYPEPGTIALPKASAYVSRWRDAVDADTYHLAKESFVGKERPGAGKGFGIRAPHRGVIMRFLARVSCACCMPPF